ncbi:TraR/DksA family transcriptional regulator [Falsiroseomonas sp. E2-1-a20]|uniref:TraR/DksA family transcriptional regulator n=1 Tax=Falsiroseomonas sp. E2-1-a20 TaxID=3239300 RepID=UPI003F2D3717
MTRPMDDAPPGVDVPEMQARLLAERAALTGISAASMESRGPVELDQTSVGRLSRMDAIQQQAMALATERRRSGSLQRIEAALARIEAGEFGWCGQCGEPIAPGRLALDPATLNCVACASRAIS